MLIEFDGNVFRIKEVVCLNSYNEQPFFLLVVEQFSDLIIEVSIEDKEQEKRIKQIENKEYVQIFSTKTTNGFVVLQANCMDDSSTISTIEEDDKTIKENPNQKEEQQEEKKKKKKYRDSEEQTKSKKRKKTSNEDDANKLSALGNIKRKRKQAE